MRKSLLVTLLLFAATTLFAQQVMVATLSHAGNVSVFYGTTALTSAVNAAQDGDTIHLSPDVFTATDITKGLVIRGAGAFTTEKTVINGDFTVNIADSTQSFEMEGIYASQISLDGTPAKITITRCNCNYLEMKYGFSCDRASIINTYVRQTLYQRGDIASGTIFAINSFIGGFQWEINSQFNLYALNCVIRDNEYGDYNDTFTFVNSIIYKENYTYGYFSADHCIFIHTGYEPPMSGSHTQQCTVLPYSDVFTTFTGTYTEEETFELTGSGASFLGTDGTQVGIYGGLVPYNPAPAYPLIATMNVGSKSGADGTLTVEVQLSNP